MNGQSLHASEDRGAVDRHLRPRDLAARWKVSERTLARWRRDGSGPAFLRLGRCILYRLADVEAHEHAVRVGGTVP